jgi:starch synthase (maltosyl-transferring)
MSPPPKSSTGPAAPKAVRPAAKKSPGKKPAAKKPAGKKPSAKRTATKKVTSEQTDAGPNGASAPSRAEPADAGTTSSTAAARRTSPPSRLVIEEVAPVVGGGAFPAKRVVGEPVDVSAAIYADGHDHLWCVVAHQPPGAEEWLQVPMIAVEPGLDRWEGRFTPSAEGIHRFRVQGWIDELGSWASATSRKLDAGLIIDSERLEGAAILDRAAERHEAAGRSTEAGELRDAAARLREGDIRIVTEPAGEAARMSRLAHASLDGSTAGTSPTFEVLVERERALFSSWYELFPRSWGPQVDGRVAHGTFADVERQLDYVTGMGFDILYLPPIHPIGRAYRKGRNNTEHAEPDDVGSPWAIGGPDGGHTAILAELGTTEELVSLARACEREGVELALDIAFQCSPDHPWVTEHPSWFKHRPDGTIQYAENPPKKYQDIYPLNFESDDWQELWEGLRDVFTHWMDLGIRVFRVDNPHTKPFAFWEWVIAELRRRDPGVILLSEAFSRPKIMRRLTQVGFTLSYSYFPWRVSKTELVEYFTDLSTSPSVDCFRPSAWPNTPDILPWHLMDAPRSQFAARALTAATLSPSWGIYGPAFELGESTPAGNGKEEYLNSEKYELRQWNRDDPDSLRGLIASLNRARSEQRALRTLRTLRFHPIENDALVCYSKTTYEGPSVDPGDPGGATVLVVANLDPHHSQAGFTWLDLRVLGLDPNRPYDVEDLLSGERYSWHGPRNYVELHPDAQPGHVFRVTQG